MKRPTREYAELADILLEIERELRALDLWQSRPPSPRALASREPFCVDTLDFHQWLQFVFIERVRLIIETEAPLPPRSDIAPLAEERFNPTALATGRLIDTIRRFDRLLNESP